MKLENNRSIEESAVQSLDGTSNELFPYLPYILQDCFEMGTPPEVVLKLIKAHTANPSCLRILDLGCGKGAVSISLARELNCQCHGIDAISEFIEEATIKAKEFNVERRCTFACGDIRTKIHELKNYDVIILGAIGPVFGNYNSTLTQVSRCLSEKGLIIIDDGYIDDKIEYSHPSYKKRSVILKQISDARMIVVDEAIITNQEVKKADEYIHRHIKRRCHELITMHPDQKHLFLDYLSEQEKENEILENKIICSTMLLRKC